MVQPEVDDNVKAAAVHVEPSTDTMPVGVTINKVPDSVMTTKLIIASSSEGAKPTRDGEDIFQDEFDSTDCDDGGGGDSFRNVTGSIVAPTIIRRSIDQMDAGVIRGGGNVASD